MLEELNIASGASGGCLYITEYPTLNMKKITCTYGYFITQFKDGIDNIINYSSTTEEICDLNLNVEEIYRCVDAEYNDEHIRMRNAAADDMINLLG